MLAEGRRVVGTADPILQHPVFRGVTSEAIDPWRRSLVLQSCRPGEIVGRPRMQALLLLLEGRLCLCEWTPQGRRVILDVLEPGGTDGLHERAGTAGHYSVASRASRVVRVPFPILDRIAAQAPAVRRNVFSLTARALRRREESLERLALPSALERIAGQLLALAEQCVDHRSRDCWRLRRLSHRELADMLLVRRETITLAIATLRRRGLLRTTADEFLLDRRRLVALRDGAPLPDPPNDTGDRTALESMPEPVAAARIREQERGRSSVDAPAAGLRASHRVLLRSPTRGER